MALNNQRREQLMDDLADRAARLGITHPVILFLEMHKPLAFLGAQMLWVAQPFLNGWRQVGEIRDVAQLLEDRAAVDALIERLESAGRSS